MKASPFSIKEITLPSYSASSSASKTPQQFVDDIVDLIMKYNGDKRLHDDVTMMVAKVG